MKLFMLLMAISFNVSELEVSTDLEMSNEIAQGFLVDISKNSKLEKIDDLFILFPMMIPIQFIDTKYSSNPPIIIDGGIQYELPYINDIYIPNFMDIGDVQIKGLDLRGTLVKITPKRG